MTILAIFFGLGIAEAQTKQETMAWIKEKIEKYGSYTNDVNISLYAKVIYINACEISFKVSWKNWEGDWEKSYAFPTDNIDFVYSYGIKFNADVVHYSNTYLTQDKAIDKVDVLQFNREANLDERFEKALKHLATFCEKKKETF
ncbi:hypothetical protein JI747_014075 [Chryseobacterium sp. RG1]|uniref:DUF4468 domain-containing protein n=1 Tax=Chryseobacterium tagetis TaxID=2801334 RepID=A0ABS8A6Q5_9FLAO|nr:hypothetical protein [Chryseobacterium tagetis]MCA6068315.1 hypothetical protein [Chryseobacterium tagetis]